MSKLIQTALILSVSLTLAVVAATSAAEAARGTAPVGDKAVERCPFSGVEKKAAADGKDEPSAKACPKTGRTGAGCPFSGEASRTKARCPFSGKELTTDPGPAVPKTQLDET